MLSKRSKDMDIKKKFIEIHYCFKSEKQKHEIFELRLDSQTLEMVNKSSEDLPAWTRLDFHQCPHCPLNTHSHPYCPVALSLVDVVKRFDNVLSYDQIDLEVITAERRVSQHTTVQKGISSLLGLLFPTSGCPRTAFFRPMVRFHLPMATQQDTIFRATGMYMLAQYFLRKEGRRGDFELHGLTQIYNNLHLLNIKIAERLRSAAQTDSSINAISSLDVFTYTLTFSIEDQLEEIRHLFTPYFSDSYRHIIKASDELNGSAKNKKDT